MSSERPLKIAFFTETYLPQINGVVTSTLTFAEELEKMGHTVLIMGPKMKGAEASCEKVWRFRSMAYPFQNEHRVIWPFSRKLKAFKEMDFDIVHIQTPFFMGHLGQYLGWKHDIPIVHTYHTYWFEYLHYFPLLPKRFRKRADMLLFTKKFCERSDHVIVPSTQMRDKLLADHLTVPLTVIPTGIDINRVVTEAETRGFRKRYGLISGEPVLIYVGRLGKEKNVYFLMQTFELILKKIPNARLLIVGDGPERKGMAKAISNLERVVFTGYLSHEEVFTAYSAADVIAFPSKTETQGLSLLEGLSQGKPAVCINAMGVKDLLGNNEGGYLTPDDLALFSEKLALLLQDPEVYRQKSADARARACLFSSTAMAERLVSVYRHVITKKQFKGDR